MMIKDTTWAHRAPVVLTGLAISLLATFAAAYPLDGYESTGIPRLQAQRLMQEGIIPGKPRPSGELMPLSMVDLRLLDQPDFTLPPADPALTAKLKSLLGQYANRYGIALLDLSDRNNPRYGEWNGDVQQNPGSVGKLLVSLALFQVLADIYPDDIEARRRVLMDTVVTADVFSVYDHHTVPFWDEGTRKYTRRPLKEGDRGTLYTYLDWMMSPSSNSAAGMVQKELILLTRFGDRYPVSQAESDAFFADTPKADLGEIFERAIQEPVTRNGLDLDSLRQGSFFTREGKKRVPGTTSYATSRSLMLFMLKMEQGKLVDEWSSREIKRLMYITERRIRYASSGVLRQAAVYFKSGSLYSCEPEEGFTCTKYHGNKRNFMNSVALVESPAGQNRLFYITTVLSNVLRKNSAQDHRDLARAIQGMLLTDHPEKPLSAGERPPALTYGEGFIGFQTERDELQLAVDTQEALLDLGYDIGEMDGVIGAKTRGAIKQFQTEQGFAANGQTSRSLVTRMREVAVEKGLSRPAGTAATTQ